MSGGSPAAATPSSSPVPGRRADPADRWADLPDLPDLSTLPGIDPAWSRVVQSPDAEGAQRRWHVLDNGVQPTAGTMLCVHGNPTWSYLWRRFLARAPEGWRVVAVDHLGMGWSERTETARTLGQRVEDLSNLTDTLGITGPVVTAVHDWGGPIGLGWALRHADQLRGVVLTNTAVHQPSSTAAPSLIRLARSSALLRKVCVDTPAFVRSATAVSWPLPPKQVRDAFAAPYPDARHRQAVGDFVADIPLEPDHPSTPTLERIAGDLDALADVPVLALWGPRDPVFSDRYLRDLLVRLPHAQVHRYEGASHLVTEDRPETAAAAWRWVADLPSGPTGHLDGGASGPNDPRHAAVEVSGAGGAPIWQRLTDRASDAGLAVAELSGQGRRISFADLHRRVSDLASGLVASGVAPGDRVAVLVPPGIDLTTAVYAVWQAGGVVVIADAGLGLRSLGRALRGAGPAHVIGIPKALAAATALRVPGRRLVVGDVPAPLRRALGAEHSLQELVTLGRTAPTAAPETPSPDHDCAVLFTSGATGPPKGVVYQYRQVQAQLATLSRTFGMGPGERFVAAFAPFALYGPVLGLTSVVPDMDITAPHTLTAAALAEAVAAIGATLVFASPAALRNVVATAGELTPDQRAALARPRLVMSAGAPVPVSLLHEVRSLLPNAATHTPYGMTEVLPVTDVDPTVLELAGDHDGVCVGLPVDGVEVAISALDAAGAAIGALSSDPGVLGEICVRAAHVKHRYDRLWATQRDSARDAGWHRTGDVGHLDEHGRLWVEGRLSHVVTAPDGPVAPVGIEQRAEALDGVAGAAVAGVGPAGTQQVVVVVVPQHRTRWTLPGRDVLAEPDLAASVRQVAGVPVAAVLVRDALPVDIRHASKVDRTALSRWADRVLHGRRPGRAATEEAGGGRP